MITADNIKSRLPPGTSPLFTSTPAAPLPKAATPPPPPPPAIEAVPVPLLEARNPEEEPALAKVDVAVAPPEEEPEDVSEVARLRRLRFSSALSQCASGGLITTQEVASLSKSPQFDATKPDLVNISELIKISTRQIQAAICRKQPIVPRGLFLLERSTIDDVLRKALREAFSIPISAIIEQGPHKTGFITVGVEHSFSLGHIVHLINEAGYFPLKVFPVVIREEDILKEFA